MDTILTSISLGLLATTSPCILPLYPGFLAYLSGSQTEGKKSRYWLGVFVLFGVLVMMLALGGVISLLSISIGNALSIIIPVADLIIICLGVLLLIGVIPLKQLHLILLPGFSHPYMNAFVYGLLYGPIALPCSGPLVVGIFAYSLTAAEALSKLSVFFWFGIGFGLPLLALSLLSGTLQRQVTRFFAVRARQVNLVGGLLLLVVGFYDLWVNQDLILAYL